MASDDGFVLERERERKAIRGGKQTAQTGMLIRVRAARASNWMIHFILL